ncbi:WD repeat-containing protein 13-like [Ischnura elegans]|uniref:WD repeat-containing protein 13-like n=1 Tax=Ischnura elegans TaxID=197161 RepID=UPI001ED8AAD4|nr:WD repeat-containing protein 13-like [Ischnura elegans]
MAALWKQQVFALDSRYNAHRAPNHPNFRTLYIRRRNQLLREYSGCEDPSVRKQYLRLRGQLLQQRYGVPADQVSQKSRSTSARSSIRVSESPDIFKLQGNSYQTLSQGEVVPTKQAEASRAIVGGNTIAENYAFVGVHHIFDQHTDAVTMIKFGNNDRSRLCCASLDGLVSVCDVADAPPKVLFILSGHEKGVTGCDWSISNDLLVSSSLDGTIRLWEVGQQTGEPRCLRIVRDQGAAEVLSCLFHPVNNNFVIAGNSSGMVAVLNISTGIYPRGGSSKVGGKILSLTFDSSGRLLWCGNDKGTIVSFFFELGSGKLSKCRRISVSEGSAITCLSYRAWISREARDPSLLVNCAANAIYLFRVRDKEGSLVLRRKFIIHHKEQLVRSTFCPIMSFRQGACVVTGSEDSCVYFLDIEREGRPATVNKLQGHASPVLGVSFNYDESLLATSDCHGLVIVWKREKR